MARILYQWIKKRLVKIGEHTSQKIEGMPNAVVSTLLEAPNIQIPKKVVSGSKIQVEVPISEIVSAVEPRYFVYKVNFRKAVYREIQPDEESFEIEVDVPTNTRTLTIYYCIQDWIENWSRTKFVQSRIIAEEAAGSEVK